MNDYILIGCTPYEAPCAQVGSAEYARLSRIECHTFLKQCKRVLAEKYPEYTCILKVKSFPHDFGTYNEVVAIWHDEKSQEEAFYLEGCDLSEWDEEALKELKQHNYTMHLES